MFDGIAGHYDLLNRLISLGLDQGWRRKAIASVGLTATISPAVSRRDREKGALILDLGCGTGDFEELLRGRADVVGMDLSRQMLDHAQRRLGPDATLVQASAFTLPFGNGAFDAAVSGFVLRNLNDIEGAMRELARVVKPGGRIALLDAIEPPPGPGKLAFHVYFRAVAPTLGALFGKRQAYSYLRDSLVQIPPAEDMCRLLTIAGFDQPRATLLSLGSIALFEGVRAAPSPSAG
ncbi:MAG: ubiquinone/menaquinone biosynthesis methyltransferase [Chloroflexi bacterium]|nr:ubiquinone/menaquinone biosynthesis methyltransferase [Chloroflexota bacterium]